MSTTEGWNRHIDTEDKKLYYKKQEGLSCLTLLFQFYTEASALDTAAVFGEISLLKDWIPVTPTSDLLY